MLFEKLLGKRVIVDKEGIVVAITYSSLVSRQVINNVLFGREPNIPAYPTVKYGDVPAKLKLMEFDEKHLPFWTIEQKDIKFSDVVINSEANLRVMFTVTSNQSMIIHQSAEVTVN